MPLPTLWATTGPAMGTLYLFLTGQEVSYERCNEYLDCLKRDFFEIVHLTLQTAMEAHRGVEVYLYSFFNFGARWGGQSTHAPAAFPHRKEPGYPLYRCWLGPRLCGRMRKISSKPGFDPRTN